MSDRPIHVLFLCTGNSARSILAEAVLSQRGGDRFRAFSAGSHPRGEVHPLALAVLAERGHPTAGLRSKSWEELAAPAAPALDVVITVCDDAAGETCPVWPGRPVTAHWGLPDPAAFGGPPDARLAAFRRTLQEIEQRIDRLLELPVESLDGGSLRTRLAEIGRPGAADA